MLFNIKIYSFNNRGIKIYMNNVYIILTADFNLFIEPRINSVRVSLDKKNFNKNNGCYRIDRYQKILFYFYKL